MVFLHILIGYRNYVKKYGKENIDVSLIERLTDYFLYYAIPIIYFIVIATVIGKKLI